LLKDWLRAGIEAALIHINRMLHAEMLATMDLMLTTSTLTTIFVSRATLLLAARWAL